MLKTRLKSLAQNKRVFSSLIISYLLILFLSIIIWFFSLLMYSDIIEEQTDELNRNMLNLICDAVDRELDNITLDSMIIASNPTIRRIITSPELMSVRDVLDARMIINILNSQVAQNEMIDSIFIYFADSGFVISNETKVNSKHYYDFAIADENIDISFEDWVDQIKQTVRRRCVYLKGKNTSGRVAYLMPLPSKYGTYTAEDMQAILVFMFKPDAITNIIESIDTFEETHITIYGDTQMLATNHCYFSEKIEENHQDYVTASVSSKHGLKVVSYMPNHIYFGKLNYLKRFTVIYFIVAILICSCIIIYSIKKNYNPLNELILYIEDKLKKICKTNEYDYLKASLDSIIDDRTKDRQLLEEQNVKIRNAYIERLFLGNADMGIPMEEYLSLLGFDFKSGNFAVILISFNNIDDVEQKNNKNLDTKHFSKMFSGYCVNIAGNTAFLIDCTEVDAAKLRENSEKLFNSLYTIYQDIVMSVSTIHNSARGIASAYDEALYTLEYIYGIGSQSIVYYEDISKTSNNYYYYPPEEERRFINSVVSGDTNEALSIYNEVWQHNLDNCTIKLELSKLLMQNFLSSLLKAFTEKFPTSSPDAYPQQLKILYMDLNSVEDIRKELYSSIKTVCEYMKNMSNDSDVELKNRIVDYIKSNYSDCNLSVERISEEFGRSRSNLFNIFKSETGEGLLFVINKIRIEAAKKFIAEDNLGTTEAAKSVGYSNVGTFLRVFKKFVGTTPGQYKEIILNYKHTMDK